MKKRIIKAAALLYALILTVCSAGAAFAVNLADAKTPLEIKEQYSLEVIWSFDGESCHGLRAQLFAVAALNEKTEFVLTDKFASCKVNVTAVKSADEWDSLCETISAYITADKLSPDGEGLTNQQGKIKFSSMAPGLYYVRLDPEGKAPENAEFHPVLVSVPGVDDEGNWIGDVTVNPKGEKKDVPVYESYTVTKVFKEKTAEAAKTRPDHVDVDIFRDGELDRSVKLGAENNWTYGWDAEPGESWSVAERNVPDGYTVTVERNGSAFTVTNTNDSGNTPEPPATGDTSNLTKWVIISAAAGVVLIGAAVALVKIKDE